MSPDVSCRLCFLIVTFDGNKTNKQTKIAKVQEEPLEF